MLTDHRIDIVVARDAGGDSASAKIDAARELDLPVVMVRRPFIPDRQSSRPLPRYCAGSVTTKLRRNGAYRQTACH